MRIPRNPKQYELTNHLGNVLSTVLDRKTPITATGGSGGSTTITHYEGDVVFATDYYPFGSPMSWSTPDSSGGRMYSGSGYRYGFNGQEKDDEMVSNYYDFGARIYDARIVRWLSVDPLAEKLPHASPYAFCLNNPVNMVDPDGRFPFPIYIRSFAPFKTFGGGFHGDGENRGFTTSSTATSRVAQTFTMDASTHSYSGLKTWSDPSSHPVLGSATEKPTGGISDFKYTANQDGSNTVSWSSTMSGANPLVPASPDIDVKTSFSLTENVKAGTLDINGSLLPKLLFKIQKVILTLVYQVIIIGK